MTYVSKLPLALRKGKRTMGENANAMPNATQNKNRVSGNKKKVWVCTRWYLAPLLLH